MCHDLFEADEMRCFTNPHETWDAFAHAHFDACHDRLAAIQGLTGHQQVERQVRHEHERMRRIKREWRHQGKDVAQVVLA